VAGPGLIHASVGPRRQESLTVNARVKGSRIMNNKCAFCDQLVAHFIRCAACGEAICEDHRTAMATLRMLQPMASAEARGPAEELPVPTQLLLCPNHRGVRAA